MISHIVAYTSNRVIGRDNAMPWHLPADLAHFKRVTLGKPIIMGRKTFESIGRPLPGRQNIVVTRDEQFQAEGITIWKNLDRLSEFTDSEEEVFLIGGGELFRQTLSVAKRLYVTEIEADLDGDVFYPAIPSQFTLRDEAFYPANKENAFAFTIKQFERS